MSAVIQVEVLYAEELVANLRREFPNAVTDGVQDAIKIVAQRIYDEVLRLVPVRTGYLRSTVGYDTEGKWFFKIFAKAPYAAYVEWGTSRMVPRLFMTRALEMHRVELIEEVENAVAKAVIQAFR